MLKTIKVWTVLFAVFGLAVFITQLPTWIGQLLIRVGDALSTYGQTLL